MQNNITYGRGLPMRKACSISRPVETVCQILQRWLRDQEQRRADQELRAMPDYLLRDIGMDRRQLEARIAGRLQVIEEASPR
ncbi:hypothetical protein ELG72_37115 [Rhizobium leguminosarum]|uniref:hypothetical protein n=1 Tax=Rhizobium TaxID=379 RepID=UPI0010321BF9|nr:hypothetical protein [Rhizobium leguminosarum]TBF87417.1 hypothetical protein ELG82_38225 [Rhizobium leguminosarum]TBG07032.1 hypothetical protein ELG80_37415 [Rhizobium leguminosarum]TBG07818.1 hypothetical protein ELG81_37015 [Rhizobium leguminosarum]TBG30723.1 hypothetical protein ELG75_37115 [Rhizobium leguminosarum]TBG50117.1 hypothetical protein ELG72_37115 [Rhizobium leguminosarum]